jgi:hypothetical protein
VSQIGSLRHAGEPVSLPLTDSGKSYFFIEENAKDVCMMYLINISEDGIVSSMLLAFGTCSCLASEEEGGGTNGC